MYTLTSAEALINREVQDIIDTIKEWGWTTPNAQINADYDRLQVLKNEINDRLGGAKRDYAISTIDAIWIARKAWKASGTGTARDKTINALERIQAVLASQPDVVEKNVNNIAAGTPEKAPALSEPQKPEQPGETKNNGKIFGMSKPVAIGTGAVVLYVGYKIIRKLIRK